MTQTDDSSTPRQPRSVIEMIAYLKEKIIASKEKAKAQFVAFINQTMITSAPDLRSILNRVRDQLRTVNPQQALAVNIDPLARSPLPFAARVSSHRNDLG